MRSIDEVDGDRVRRFRDADAMLRAWVPPAVPHPPSVRWHPHDEPPEKLSKSLIWHPTGIDDGLAIDLPVLFGEALSD